ncbi:MAG TPA: hypothetical protein PKG54_11605 [Phycisphaerae bacterium]|jgi:hypothetical protein|nr:hypothetical protein [Phycisphaerae bacterium]HOB75160.1 hypothetical protein [Phycisphaerae bacterium]HOJ54618.1 hypothetical protein [Phycisphaerae bacterium]HOL27244.1 hypothetical protein [Phycisphaerae bacterium]HPP21044.1 hypothetical protein [Phycisphaerae bacterium]
MSVDLESSCRSLVQLMNLAPEAITEIDEMLKKDLPRSVAGRLNRIVAALYEISLLQDQITKHLAHSPARSEPRSESNSWTGRLPPQANSVQTGAGPSYRAPVSKI